MHSTASIVSHGWTTSVKRIILKMDPSVSVYSSLEQNPRLPGPRVEGLTPNVDPGKTVVLSPSHSSQSIFPIAVDSDSEQVCVAGGGGKCGGWGGKGGGLGGEGGGGGGGGVEGGGSEGGRIGAGLGGGGSSGAF